MARERRRMTEREGKNETRLLYILLVAFVIVVAAVLYLYFHGDIAPNGSPPVQ
jgi:hypothetical protein